ncbi:MAG: glycosyltransferase family 4 protein [Chloroflexi bacterium]|nr:glycosyltransferase family 4 protein [Chloroflexota bacterium]
MATTDKKLHILLIHQAFVALDEAGGTRHYEFARYLLDQGHRVTVITSPVSYLTGEEEKADREASKQVEKLAILRAATYRGLHRSFVHRLLSFFSFTVSAFFAGLRVKNVDLVWGTSPPLFQAATAWALARIKRVPFLFEVRDLWPAFAVAVGVLRNRLLIAASEWLERFLYRRADRLVLNSPGFEEHVKARGGRKFSIVPNGADAAMFDPDADGLDFRKQYALQGKFIVLYAGAHGLSNDLGIVLQAADELSGDQNIRIVLLGDGKDKPVLQEQAARMNLSNVHFLPPMPKAQMGAALAAADACLAILKPLKLYRTVYPNKVFDYMAAGRPVLLAIDGAIRKVIEGASAGAFVPPGNPAALAEAIRNFAANPTEARRMGRAGRIYLEQHFNRPMLAKQMELVLQETVATKGSQPTL